MDEGRSFFLFRKVDAHKQNEYKKMEEERDDKRNSFFHKINFIKTGVLTPRKMLKFCCGKPADG